MRSDWTFPKSTIFCAINCDSLLWKGFWLFGGQGVLGNCGAYAITLINPINKIFNQRIRDSYAISRCSQRFAYFSRLSHPQLPPKYLNGAICVLTWKKYVLLFLIPNITTTFTYSHLNTRTVLANSSTHVISVINFYKCTY